MDTEPAHARYRDLLYARGHGYPLWKPEPSHTLPAQRVKGISIGDIGILTNDGGFEYLWNVHLPADHPYNGNRVPKGFVPLSDLDEARDLSTTAAFHPKNAVIRVETTKKREIDLKAAVQFAIAGGGAGYSFEAGGDVGAVLVLPRGALRVDAKGLPAYRQYAVSHAESWYQYINGEDRNLGVQNGALCLVTGTDKCSAWAVTSFAKPNRSHSLTVNVAVAHAANAEASSKRVSMEDLGTEFRTGVVDVSEDSQCVFLRGFVISVRNSLWSRWFGIPPKVKPLQGPPALPTFVGPDRPFARGAEADIDIVDPSYSRILQKSPVAIRGDQLLNDNLDASIVVLHDNDLMALKGRENLHQRGGTVEDNAAPQSYVVVVDGVCTLIPEKPTSITLTSDSVTLDNAVTGNLLYIQHQGSVAFPVTQVPPEPDIKRSEIDPTSSSIKQHLFALVIGIDLYQHAGPGFHNLRGAVADADAMDDFLTSTLGVDPTHVCNLRNGRATRDGIINALSALALDDRIHRDDAIVIFFAGHGSQTTVTGPNGSRLVEMIIPHDFLPKTSSNPHQQGIFDTTLAHLFTDLAKEKGDNITVIFDSCHAGSSTRSEVKAEGDRLSRGIVLPENYSITTSLPPPVEEENGGGGARKAQVAAGFEFYGLASHVLLAACSQTQSAYEYNKRGCFTQELLSKLRTVVDRNVTYAVTYRSLIHQLNDLPGQHPQCEGKNVDRVLFNGKAPIGSYQLYSVVTRNGRSTLEDGGAVHGITEGAEFNVYATKNLSAQPLCRLAATNIRVSSCDLAPAGSIQPDDPQTAWALQVSPGERPKLGVVLDPEDKFLHVKDDLSGHPFIDIVDSKHDHELTLRAEYIGTNPVTAFVVADKYCNKAGLEQLEEKCPIGDIVKIRSVLEAAADFFFHLRRRNPDSRLANYVVTEAYELRDYEEYGSNLVKGDEISLTVTHDPETATPYGFKLINKGSRNLYVWAFLFNVGDLSVDVIQALSDAKSHKQDFSLPVNGTLTLGYGDGGAQPRAFYLGKDTDTDVAYMKIYLTTEPVKLSHIARGSAFAGDKRKGEPWSPKLLSDWSTILIPIVQRAAK